MSQGPFDIGIWNRASEQRNHFVEDQGEDMKGLDLSCWHLSVVEDGEWNLICGRNGIPDEWRKRHLQKPCKMQLLCQDITNDTYEILDVRLQYVNDAYVRVHNYHGYDGDEYMKDKTLLHDHRTMKEDCRVVCFALLELRPKPKKSALSNIQ